MKRIIYNNLKLNTKFTLFYIMLFAISIVFSSFLFQLVNADILEKKIGDLSLQTLNTVNENVDTMVRKINSYSKLLLADDYLQQVLRKSIDTTDVEVIMNVRTSMALYIDAMEDVSSIYIFDMEGTKYAVSKKAMDKLDYTDITSTDWYNDLVRIKGKYKLVTEPIFDKGPGRIDNIAFARIINSTLTGKQIGTMIINIPMKAFEEVAFVSLYEESKMAVYTEDRLLIGDEKVMAYANIKENQDTLMPEFKHIDGRNYLCSTVYDEEKEWFYTLIVSFEDVAGEYRQFSLITFLIVFINSIIIFFGGLLVSRLITKPVTRLMESMKKVEKGEFEHVDIIGSHDEIGMLQHEYNLMVDEIEKLINRIVDEQKLKRKVELNMLQAQIKPHFLYNSLDAIAYLSMVGGAEDAYNLTLRLANYYRQSLSKGSELITMEKEIMIVKDYLAIQKVRFPDIINDHYDIDEKLLDIPMLKLVLQPLVENALVHGITPKGEPGEINISLFGEEESIVIKIEDDGVGMEDDMLNMLLNNELDCNSKSFGLRGTIERLKIYYGKEDIYKIRSVKGEGTIIEIRIPNVH